MRGRNRHRPSGRLSGFKSRYRSAPGDG
jgi:hypothetical protein